MFLVCHWFWENMLFLPPPPAQWYVVCRDPCLIALVGHLQDLQRSSQW